MRIYLYLRTFPRLGTPINGGLNKAIHGLACGLVRAGADVTILCEGRVAGRIHTENGFEIRCFANRTRPSSFTVSHELKQFLDRDLEPGVVVLNGIFMPSVSLLARYLHRRGIHYIAAPHDPFHPEIFHKRWYIKWPYWYLLERPMLRQASAIQVLDERHEEYLRKLDVDTPVIALPNGYMPVEAQRNPTLPDPGETRLLFLGRMDSHNKGLDLLLRAFAHIATEGGMKLTLQGPDTGDRRSLEKQANSLVRKDQVSFENVDFTQPSSQVISGHHLFCLPSRFEGFGMAALEAMLAARPLLVTSIAGIASHVSQCDCGVVVASNVDSIQKGLLQLLARRNEWAEMGRRGREYALKNLCWDQIGERALQEYARICRQEPQSAAYSRAVQLDIPRRSTAIPAQASGDLVFRDA
jgi:glycosyltransferase involved in cell wall biosynthesis